MKAYTAAKLTEVLKAHALWLADFRQGSGANLSGADLSGAYLSGANLARASLARAYLAGANLSGTNLAGADLSGASLAGAYLAGANLLRTYLAGANLSGADLSGAYLSGANLARANLTGANLIRADLAGAYLAGAHLPSFQLPPEEGSFVAWKKVQGGVVLKLEICADARRTSSLVGRKCRASAVRVLAAFGAPDSQKTFPSKHDARFIYTVGEVAIAPDYSDDIREECVGGLHFFMTRREAEDYND